MCDLEFYYSTIKSIQFQNTKIYITRTVHTLFNIILCVCVCECVCVCVCVYVCVCECVFAYAYALYQYLDYFVTRVQLVIFLLILHY